jgi:hypothetical protein
MKDGGNSPGVVKSNAKVDVASPAGQNAGAAGYDVWKKQAETVASGIRRRVLAHTIAHNGGYLSQACSSAEIFAALYTRLLKFKRESRHV